MSARPKCLLYIKKRHAEKKIRPNLNRNKIRHQMAKHRRYHNGERIILKINYEVSKVPYVPNKPNNS